VFSILPWMLLLLPLAHFSAALLGGVQPATKLGWRLAATACWLALLATLATGLLLLADVWLSLDWVQAGLRHKGGVLPLRVDTLSVAMAGLIAILGLVVTRFSSHYLHGETNHQRFQRWLSATLGSVAVTILSDHFLLLLAGWVSTSLCLHQLLLFYPQRPRAQLAAHKKFLSSRLGELCLLTAFLLLYQQHDSFVISTVLAAYDQASAGSAWQTQTAAVLIAVAALLKCAQLPLHGWLMQVMEAPTPVSALLHAGIINLGGFLLLLLAPVLEQSTAALWLILIVAGMTIVIASLSMMTRISIKVMLAWSTCAQMGFMLLECALGLYELALLHLLAHSIYKANAFLNAGNAVQDHLRVQLGRDPARQQRRQPASYLLALLPALLILTAIVWWLPKEHHPAMLLMLAFAASGWLLEAGAARGLSALWLFAGGALLVSLYFVWQLVFADLMPTPAVTIADNLIVWIWLSSLLLVFFGAFVALRCLPQKRPTQLLFLYLYGGLYLDEWMTRLSMWLWPKPESGAESAQPALTIDEVRS
jgi:NAD(P)H-quinone oxidoreductase subunit 5